MSAKSPRWERPPSGRLPKWHQLAIALQRKPGRWALASVSDSRGVASNLKKRTKPFCDGGFEIVERKTDDGHKVYVRYVGEE